MIQDVYLVLDDFGGRIGSAWRENQISRPHIGVNEGNGMGYLKLVILVLAYALIPPAFAQTCCPAGCAPEANRCVTTGPLWTRCIPIACADGSRKPSGDSAAGPRQYILTLPASEHASTAWQVAIEALLLAAQSSGGG